MQIELARLLRADPPPGVLLVIPDPGHHDAVRRALVEPPLSDYLAL